MGIEEPPQCFPCLTATPCDDRPRPSGLADVIEIILPGQGHRHRRLRPGLAGRDRAPDPHARIVIASVGTYLRFAEAVNRLDIAHDSTSQGLPELLHSIPENVTKSNVKGLAEGVKEAIKGD